MDKPEQSVQPPRTGPGAGPFMDLAARRGPGRMVFCVPDGFLRRGCGTAHLERAARRERAIVVPPPGSRGAQTPSLAWACEKPAQSLPSRMEGWGGAWRARPSQDATLAQNLTAEKPHTGTTCYLGEVVHPTDNSKLNLKGAESME